MVTLSYDDMVYVINILYPAFRESEPFAEENLEESRTATCTMHAC